ncbi:MAG TPA: HD domain-containing phosphohydrolase [Candidatus Xenobia bacterium]|jgi:putative two-component system response regulator
MVDSTPVILIVDDTDENRQMLERIFRLHGSYTIHTATNGKEALEMVEETLPDLVLLDVVMPELDGLEVCRKLKGSHRTRLIPIIMITGLQAIDDRVRAFDAGADDYITKPFNVVEIEARARNLLKLKRLVDELDEAQSVLYSLARAIEIKDKYTEGHSDRVAVYCEMLGKAANLTEREVDALRKGGLLHDVGKIGIPDAILNKPGPLDWEEMETMKTHPGLGFEICRGLKSLHHCLPVIRSHHERLDGTGYPDGLKGSQVPLVAQVAAVADIYDALATARCYKRAFPPEMCYDILKSESRKGWWDGDLVELLFHQLEVKNLIPVRVLPPEHGNGLPDTRKETGAPRGA